MKKLALFLDGQFNKADLSLIESLAPGVVKGKGVFETMRAYQGQIFALEKHLARIRRGLKCLGIKSSYSQKSIKEYLARLLQVNDLKDGRVRLSVWQEKRIVRIAIVCVAAPSLSAKIYRRGFKTMMAKVRRPKTIFSQIKSLDYACFRQAFIEARQHNCDEAILLNHRNEIVEGSRSNLFFVKDHVIYTPALCSGCLKGITRQWIIQRAKSMSILCRQVKVKLDQLFSADEAFLTNSLMGVVPLTEVNGKMIGQGKMGRVTLKLSQAYRRLVKDGLRKTRKAACPTKEPSV